MLSQKTYKAISLAAVTAVSISSVFAYAETEEGFKFVEDPKSSLTTSQLAFVKDTVIIDTPFATEETSTHAKILTGLGEQAVTTVVGKTCAIALTTQLDPATRLASHLIEKGVTAFTGSATLGYFAKVGLYDTTRETARNTLRNLGHMVPGLIKDVVEFYKKPSSALEVLGSTASKALTLGTNTVASYFLSEPMDRVLGTASYGAAFLLTQNPIMAHATSTAVTAGANYIGVNKFASRKVGSYAAQGIKASLRGAYNLFFGA